VAQAEKNHSGSHSQALDFSSAVALSVTVYPRHKASACLFLFQKMRHIHDVKKTQVCKLLISSLRGSFFAAHVSMCWVLLLCIMEERVQKIPRDKE
jgi:hypothetical protein